MIRVEGLAYAVDGFRLRLSLEVAGGEYFVLLGPPGAGKSLLLECLAGLRRPAAGRLEIGGEDVTAAEPRERRIGYVPQDYALFTGRTVYENIAFGPRVSRWPAGEIDRAVRGTARLVGIAHLLDRRVPGLSGGEKQRVALARALAIRPRLLLLDEPVSALDEATRESVCMELKRIQRETGTTTLHVCHNFEEARIVADRLAVLRAGSLVQAGTPGEVFARPRDAELARFLRVGSVLHGSAEPEGAGSRLCAGPVEIRSADAAAAGGGERGAWFVVRADEVRVSAEPPGPGGAGGAGRENVLEAVLAEVSPRGLFTRVDAEVAPGVRLTAYVPRAEGALEPGGRAWLSFPASAVHLLEDGPPPGEAAGPPA